MELIKGEKMKNLSLIFLLLLIVSCASNSYYSDKVVRDGARNNIADCLVNGPEWIAKPDQASAVGISESADFSFGREKARADGLQQIAQQINTKVESMLDQKRNEAIDETFYQSVKSALQLSSDTVVNYARDAEYYVCPKMVGNVEGYQTFVKMTFEPDKIVDMVNIALDRERAKIPQGNTAQIQYLESIEESVDVEYIENVEAASAS
jgi:hypothetical protein